MNEYRFRILNVFAREHALSGNPLAVFEDGRGLDDTAMQALALQFNLSETTFILPSTSATARVRIFTPTFEMPFAGHPTLGTAHVVRDQLRGGDHLTLEMRVGVVPVSADGDRWTFEAKAPRTREVACPRDGLAAMLGLAAVDLGTTPLWVDTGSEQTGGSADEHRGGDALQTRSSAADAARQPRAAGFDQRARNGLRLVARRGECGAGAVFLF